MVSDPRGEVSGAEEQIDVCEETTEDSSPNQSIREMENPEQTNSSAEESRSGQPESEDRAFVINLYRFMKDRGTPIERIPHLGFKQINLWKIFKAVETLGGYDSVTARRLWKNVYDELGGSPGSTSAATCTRRHYERLVLPFERHRKGEEDKPLPPSKPRKQYKRSDESKSSKAEGKKRRRTAERDDLEKLRADHHCERGVCSHPSPWPMSSEHQESDRLAQGILPDSCPRDKPLLQPLSPALVISPLEKKKRLAQASLSVATSAALEEGSEHERPSVIQLSHSSSSSQSPARIRHASDGSPLPLSSPSASLSRSPSPYSVSSEDCVAVSTRRRTPAPEVEKQPKPAQFGTPPNPEPGILRVCKPVSRYLCPKELAIMPRPHYQDFLQCTPTHPDKTQRSLPAWAMEAKVGLRHSAIRIPVPASLGSSCWVPSASSFSKVVPRRPISLQPSYKPHHHQPHPKRPSSAEAFVKKIPFADRKDKAKMMMPKPLSTQQYLLHSQASLPVPYLLPAFDRTRVEAVEQLKTMQPFLLPAHLAIPPSQTHPTHPLPVGSSFPGPYEAPLRSYPYPLPLWPPPAGYSMGSLQPY
ncbi:AT-rich interactive domain-containing protein 5A isoform X2 [Salminus brasiliensis]|uniref:AT-rich interactive domain-containing protein 5A isoform X2 n=1 Tax=Salminus brasiliensis TaxID=930266 RepID=UPI003B839DD1